jgi:hypothetical protein
LHGHANELSPFNARSIPITGKDPVDCVDPGGTRNMGPGQRENSAHKQEVPKWRPQPASGLTRRKLSLSTAKLSEHPMSTSDTTTDHDTIRKWVERRNGRPAVVKGTEGKDGEGILRIDFRHADKLEDIDWDTFFETFEDRKLAFVYQDKTADGKESRFFKFVSRQD